MLRIGIIGEHNPEAETHRATDAALEHSLAALGAAGRGEWVSSCDLTETQCGAWDGLWVAPGPPHRCLPHTLAAIRYARIAGVPIFGNCGGFQLLVLEFARAAAGVPEAVHAEYAPDGEHPVIIPFSCSLRGKTFDIAVTTGSKAGALYGTSRVTERYYCSFGVNPAYRQPLQAAGLEVSGADDQADWRIVELSNHPFYLATLFVPQVQSEPGSPHPLVTGFVKACLEERSATLARGG